MVELHGDSVLEKATFDVHAIELAKELGAIVELRLVQCVLAAAAARL